MPPDNLPESVSWVLALGDSLRAAVSERELVHLIEAPILLEVPRSPPYCRHVVAWNPVSYTHLDVYKRQSLLGVSAPPAQALDVLQEVLDLSLIHI